MSKTTRITGSVPAAMVMQHQRSTSDQRSSSNSTTTVSIQEMLAREARGFLVLHPTHEDRFAYYRIMEKLDPEVLLARNYLSLMIQRSYLGPRLDTSDKTYTPTSDFMANVNLVLAEMEFSSRIGALAKDMIRHGNAFLRVKRIRKELSEENPPEEGTGSPEQAAQFFVPISSSEILPPDNVTIISERYRSNPKEFKGVLNSPDYFVIAEERDRKDKAYTVVWDAELEPQPGTDGKPPEVVLPARDVLHVAWDQEGSQMADSFNRPTYNIWGLSIYESILLFTKAKLTVITDYVRWIRSGLPRWVINMALDDVLRLSNYEGTMEERISKALDASRKVYQNFQEELYYWDNNPQSPTYRKKLPIESDAILALSDKNILEQKGGASSPDASIMNFIKECNRAIASAMGVPLTLFNYNEGSTYATSKVTAKFMAGYGGGLLRTIEIDVKDFLKKEFLNRGFVSTPLDWDNLYLEYDRDDIEELQARSNAELAQANKLLALANVARTLYEGGLFTLNECRKIVILGAEALLDMKELPEGDSLRPLQPMIQAGTGLFATQAYSAVATPTQIPEGPQIPADATQAELEKKLSLNKHEPVLEKKVKTSLSDAYAYHMDKLADAVEKGAIKK